MSERLLTAEEAAARWSVKPSWLLEHARAGNVPCVRLGRYVRFDPDDLDAWKESCKQPGRPVEFRKDPRK